MGELTLGVFPSLVGSMSLDFAFKLAEAGMAKGHKVNMWLSGNAVMKEKGKESPVLAKAGANFYVLSDDLETRGFTAANVNAKVKVIGYGDIVDLIMNDYEKTAWL